MIPDGNHASGRLRRLLTTDPRSDASLILVVGSVGIVVLAIALRLKLRSFVSADVTNYFVNWFDHLRTHGLSGFGVNFSENNFPYLFLLYLSGFVPVTKVFAIKLAPMVFDFIAAFALFRIVTTITEDRVRAALAALAFLFLPTVFLNSSLWGQSDVIYVSFILFSLDAALKDRTRSAWTWFGIALSFKLQAVFFLPVLAYVWLKKRGVWYAPSFAALAFLALSLPPILFGRGLLDTLGVHARAYGTFPKLTVAAPNPYYWVPADLFRLFDGPAIVLAIATVALVLLFCVLRMAPTRINLVVVSGMFLLLAPFLLPQMHDRYFYGFEVLCFVLAALDYRKTWLVFVSQFVAFFSYSSFLFETQIVPWPVLSMVMMVLVAYFFFLIAQRADVALVPDRRSA